MVISPMPRTSPTPSAERRMRVMLQGRSPGHPALIDLECPRGPGSPSVSRSLDPLLPPPPPPLRFHRERGSARRSRSRVVRVGVGSTGVDRSVPPPTVTRPADPRRSPELRSLPSAPVGEASSRGDTAQAMSQENVEIAARWYEVALSKTDLVAAMSRTMAFCHPNVEWSAPEDGTTYRGREGVRQRLEEWLESFADYRYEIQRIIDCGGDEVLVEGTEVGRGATSAPSALDQLRAAHVPGRDDLAHSRVLRRSKCPRSRRASE